MMPAAFALARHRLGVTAMAPPPRPGQVLRTGIPDTMEGIRFEMHRMVQHAREGAADPVVVDAARMVLLASEPKNRVSELGALFNWAKGHFHYVSDPVNKEFLQTPARMVRQTQVPREMLARILAPIYSRPSRNGEIRMNAAEINAPLPKALGDCVPFSQKAIVRNGEGRYEVVALGRLSERWTDCHVVSYDEAKGAFEFDRITRFVDKGVLPVFRVRLSNGTEFRCTENHEIYVFERRSTRSPWRMRVMTLRGLLEARGSASSGHIFAMAVAKKIPAAGDPVAEAVSYDHLWVEGLYVAEGWRERLSSKNRRVRIGMNNPEVIAELKERLEAIGQPYGETVRKDGLSTVGFHVSDYGNYLADGFGKLSGDRRVPDLYLSLSREQMGVLLEAFAIGDGYRPKTGQWARWAHLVYNTKSDIFARQVAFMHLVLGRPLSFYRQPAWKMTPAMYRLYEYKGNAEEKAGDVVSSRIVSVEADEAERCCDITVEKNHNFVLDGGPLVHNCDEGSCLMAALCGAVGIVPRFRFGGSHESLYHVWAQAEVPSGENGMGAGPVWVDMDITEPTYELGQYAPFRRYAHMDIFEA